MHSVTKRPHSRNLVRLTGGRNGCESCSPAGQYAKTTSLDAKAERSACRTGAGADAVPAKEPVRQHIDEVLAVKDSVRLISKISPRCLGISSVVQVVTGLLLASSVRVSGSFAARECA